MNVQSIHRQPIPFAVVGVTTLFLAFTLPEAVAAEGNQAMNTPFGWWPLILAQAGWLLLVGVAAPAYAALKKDTDRSELRGLNLPRGSIRSMLALLIVGSFVNLLVFGAPIETESMDIIVPAFATLAGSVTGFYFGERTATPKPEDS